MTTKFNSNVHFSCPVCGFEVLHIFMKGQKCVYLFKDGTFDFSSISNSLSDEPEITHGNMCNHVNCDWKEDLMVLAKK